MTITATVSTNALPNILLVDDDVHVLQGLSRGLSRGGFRVSVAADAPSAIRTVTSQPFDAVVSDIGLPEMTGIDFARFLRSQQPDVPILLMTGDPTLDSALAAFELGVVEYLPKPVDLVRLRASVHRAVQLHRLTTMSREAHTAVLEENPESLRDADLGDRLDRAFEAMFMAFQPIVMPRDQKIYGYEALMRTREPSMPNPGLILEAAERLGRVHELGARVRSLSAEAFRSAPDDAFLFVNLHTSDLLDDALFDPEGPLAKIATRVILEVTERATLAHMHDVAGRTKHLRELGFRLAVDDLGAGYAGLSSFAMLEPELTKLDMSLVRGIDKSPVRQRVVASMTTLCKQLGVELVAEGVETREERDALDALGCTLMQGYHFARPAPPFATVAW